jgi:hypothetical protein
MITTVINVNMLEHMVFSVAVVFRLICRGGVIPLIDVMGSMSTKKGKATVALILLKDEAKDARGFRVVDGNLISSSPLSQLSTRITVDSPPSNSSWIDKVVNALVFR